MSRCRIRSIGIRWAVVAFAVAAVSMLSTAPFPARAEEFPPASLAVPRVVAAGETVEFVLNESRLLFYVSPEPVGTQLLVFDALRDGHMAFGFALQGYGAVSGLEPGRWALRFYRVARIALGFALEIPCGIPDPGEAAILRFNCGGLVLTEPTAYMVRYLDTTVNYDYRVEGDVDSHFFDLCLRPIGDGPAIRVRGFDSLLIVLVPRSPSVVVGVSAAVPPPPVEVVFGGLALAGAFAVAALVVERRSRRRRDVITADDAKGTLK